MAKEEGISLEGRIEEALSNGMFRVSCENGLKVTAHLGGKMRVHNIRVIPGDKVTVEVSGYDLTKGRITYRTR